MVRSTHNRILYLVILFGGIITTGILVGLISWWFMLLAIPLVAMRVFFEKREYREINGRLYVREFRGDEWEDVEEHLKREHPEEYAKLRKRE